MIDDILQVIRKGPEIASQMDSLRFNNRSVARGANDATFQFPVLISNTIPVDMASTVTRTMEKTYVAFTRTWLSMNPTIDITMDRNIMQYLKRFHQNVSLESAVENLLVDGEHVAEYLERAENDEYYLMTNGNGTFGVLFNKADRATVAMLESHKSAIREFLSDYDLTNFPYIGTKQTYTESFIDKAVKFRDKIKDIKDNKPDAYSSDSEIKAYVDKNYDDLVKISKFIENEPEKLRKEEIRGTIAILIPFIVAIAAIPFSGSVTVMFVSEVIGIIVAAIYSILYYIRAYKDADTARDLRKVRDTLNRIDKKKFKEEDRKKIQRVCDGITDAVDAYTVNARITKESSISDPVVYQEWVIADSNKFRNDIRKIKNSSPTKYSSESELKKFVDYNYKDLMLLADMADKEPESFTKETVGAILKIVLSYLAAVGLAFGGTLAVGAGLYTASNVILIGATALGILNGVISILYPVAGAIRLMNDKNAYNDLRKIALALERYKDVNGLPIEYKNKLEDLIQTIKFSTPGNYNESTDFYSEAPDDDADSFASDVIHAAIAGREKEQLQNTQKMMVARAKEQKSPVLLSDNDAKKANDIMPYALQVRLMAVNDKNEFVQFMDFVIGVKAIMHPVSSDEIIENIQRALKNQSIFFRFLRWTSGEISLVKNLILNIDDIRDDVLNRANGKNPWFGKLKRLKDRKISVQNFTSPYALVPNSTLVISSYEAEYLKSHFGIDITDRRVARGLVHTLFLMAFIIVDDANGVIDILYDGSHDFQTYSLETLEKEVSLNSNKLGREIGRMIAH